MSSKAPPVISHSAFDPSKLVRSDPKPNKSGGKSVFMNYNTKRLYLQYPKLRAQFGFNPPFSPPGETPRKDAKWSIPLSLDLDDQKQREFYEKLQKIDEDNIIFAQQNSSLLWGKPLSSDTIRDNYTGLIQTNISKKDPSHIFYSTRMKLSVIGEKSLEKMDMLNEEGPIFDIELYDPQSKTKIYGSKKLDDRCEIETIKGSFMTIIGALNGIWVANKSWGCTFQSVQGAVFEQERLSGYSFVDEDKTDETEEVSGEEYETVEYEEGD